MKGKGFSLHRRKSFWMAIIAIVILAPLHWKGFRVVWGSSMHPKFPRPITLIRVIKTGNLKEGDIVSFRHGGFFGTSVKWAKIIQPTQDGNCWVWTEGDNEDRSGDSRDFWWLRKSEIEGKVVWAWPSTSASVSPLFRSVPPPPDGEWLAKQILKEMQQPVSVSYKHTIGEGAAGSISDSIQVKGCFRVHCNENGRDVLVLRGDKGIHETRIRTIVTRALYYPKEHKIGVENTIYVESDPQFLRPFAQFLREQTKITLIERNARRP